MSTTTPPLPCQPRTQLDWLKQLGPGVMLPGAAEVLYLHTCHTMTG